MSVTLGTGSLSATNFIIRLVRTALVLHPGHSLGTLRQHVRFITHGLLNRSLLSAWWSRPSDPLLDRAMAKFPMMEGAMYWPYINHQWQPKKSLDVIEQHYKLLATGPKLLVDSIDTDVTLVDLKDFFNSLSLRLEKASWFVREGEVVLSAFVGDERLYSLAFTLGIEDGQAVAYVGALQGRSLEHAQDTYKEMTHAMHGMRPRDFMVTSFKMLCVALNIETFWGVSSECRQHNGAYFKGSHVQKIAADYDEVWQEHGGAPTGSGFFAVSTQVRYRDLAEIASKKRAQYRRRYAMLDEIQSRIRSGLEAG